MEVLTSKQLPENGFAPTFGNTKCLFTVFGNMSISFQRQQRTPPSCGAHSPVIVAKNPIGKIQLK